MKAIITVGISASGKSTWAREFTAANPDFLEVNRDYFRWKIMEESGLEPCWANWKWKWENKVTERCDALIEQAAERGFDLIISDTNLNGDRAEALAARLKGLGYEVEFKLFDITYDEAVKRDNARANGVGHSVIQEQYQKYRDLLGLRVKQNPMMTRAVIVDIDGTVAIMGNHRGPFEWDRVHLDDPHLPIIQMVKGLQAAGNHVVFTSGRDGSCRALTREWILEHFHGWGEGEEFTLLMRTPGDMRKDTIVKEEIFRNDILPYFYVTVVLDDRPSVCRMWRDLGLNVVQVGNPYIEF